jgi:hypothetical protein
LDSDGPQLEARRGTKLLKQFKTREGHCNVPRLHKEDGANLGVWVSNQRQRKKMGKVDPDRQKILQEIGFRWAPVGNRRSAPWDEMLSSLKQFKKREGHCNVPQSHTEDGASLGLWLTNQRQRKKMGKVDPDRLMRLEEVDGWGGSRRQ